MSITYKLSDIMPPAFADVHKAIREGTHQQFVLKGGRGSAKSSYVSEEVWLQMLKDAQLNAVVMRQVGNTIYHSVYQQYLWAAEQLGIRSKTRELKQRLEIIYKPTGQKIMFFGADDPGKLKSLKTVHGYTGLLHFEELDQFAGEAAIRNFEQSILRGGPRFLEFKSFNPPQSAQNWANLYCKVDKPGQFIHHTTYLTTPKEWLGERFLQDAEFLKETNPRAYAHEYLGEANGTGGMVFENLTLRPIAQEERAAFDRIYNGIDWGWYPDPFRFIRAHYQANEHRLYLFDEISGNKLSNDKIAQKLEEHGINGEDLITADSGGEGPKSIGDLKSKGYYIRGAIKGPGSVEYSMKWLCSLREIIIDPKACPHAAEEFLHYEYERNKDGEIISGYPDKDNHSIDAVRYALERVWRRKGQ